MQRRWLAIALGTVAVAAGCARDAAPDTPASRLPTYQVSEAPVLVIEDDGTPEKQFTRVSARRMPDGEVVVGDQGGPTIRVFGRDGRARRQLARRGGGPGELPGDFLLASFADTVFAFGRPPMSPPDVSVYTSGGGFLSRFRPQAGDARSVTVLDRLATGQLVAQRGMLVKVLAGPPELGVLVPDSITYGFLPTAGGGSAEVAWLPPVVERWRFAFPMPRPHRVLPTGTGEYTLRGAILVVASGDRLWLADAASGGLRAVDATGREVVATRLSLEPRPHDRAQLDRRRDRDLAAATRALDSLKARALYDPEFLPPTAPLLSAAHAGADGEVWLRLFDVDADAAPQRFVVVDRAGAEVARATLPAGLDVQHIGTDFVLGVRRDGAGVESVHEHALRRR